MIILIMIIKVMIMTDDGTGDIRTQRDAIQERALKDRRE